MTLERTAGRERVQKVLAAAGVGSRRQCEALIAAGRVRVNGEVVRLGDRADAAADVLTVDGVRVLTNPELVHYLLNKPRGVVTTMHDPQQRPTVGDYVASSPRVFPVGRLDADTEGLLLLTNDGPLAQRLTHPSYEIPKTYVAQLRGTVRRQALRMLTEGIELSDGVAAATSVRTLASARDETLLEIVVTEGRNRLVRRMLGAAGLTLERLARVKLGPLSLGDMGQGRVRPLTGREVAELYAAVRLGDADTDDAPDDHEDHGQ
jgi:23S rRNA pseudouridine2605 synthase